jgi:hypothetical protein
VLFGACVGTPVIYDENLPMEESARLFFMPGIEVTSYNGIPVPTKKSLMHGFGYKSEWQYVSLPPGEMEFVVDIYVNYGGFIYTAKEAIFKYTFGEKEYCLNFSFGGDENSLWGISIYEQSPKEMKLIKENRIDFVPFHGQDKDKEKGRTVFQ